MEFTRGSPPIHTDGLKVQEIRSLCRKIVENPESFDMDLGNDEDEWSSDLKSLVQQCLTVSVENRLA